MSELCFKSKIIYDFMKNYKQGKWNSIIKSLLEISILNLYIYYKKHIFSEEDLFLILDDLQKKERMQKFNGGNYYTNNNSGKKRINLNMDIVKFRNKLTQNLNNSFNMRNLSYRSYNTKTKNINELNIYASKQLVNKSIHHYNKSSDIKCLRALINYNNTDPYNNKKNKNIYKINSKLIKKKCINSSSNINNCKNEGIDGKLSDNNYNTIEYSENANIKDTNQSLFYIYEQLNKNDKNDNCNCQKKSKNFNKDCYIKVQKKNTTKETNSNKNTKSLLSKNNNMNDYFTKQNTLIVTDKENNIPKNKWINNTKRNPNMNKIENKNRNFSQYISVTSNNTLTHNTPKKKNGEKKNTMKLLKYRNNNMVKNELIKKMNENNSREIRNNQFANIKKNFKDFNLRNMFYKQSIEIKKNKEIETNPNNTISNLECFSIKACDIYNKYKRQRDKFKVMNPKRIINYNSFNSHKFKKHKISINDSLPCIKKEEKSKIIRK